MSGCGSRVQATPDCAHRLQPWCRLLASSQDPISNRSSFWGPPRPLFCSTQYPQLGVQWHRLQPSVQLNLNKDTLLPGFLNPQWPQPLQDTGKEGGILSGRQNALNNDVKTVHVANFIKSYHQADICLSCSQGLGRGDARERSGSFIFIGLLVRLP